VTDTFVHFDPQLIVAFGDNALHRLARDLDQLQCHRAVLFCGKSLGRNEQIQQKIKQQLGDRLTAIYTSVQSHTPLDSLGDARRILSGSCADAVIALGGGSAIVTARAAAMELGEDRNFAELQTSFPPGGRPIAQRLLKPKLPLFSIPTTPTTAHVKSGAAALDRSSRRRVTAVDPTLVARGVYLDPELIAATPSTLFLDASLNTFAMCVQGLESAACNPLAQGQLLQGLRLLRDSLVPTHNNQHGIEDRTNLMIAAILVGLGTNHAPIGLCAALGHCLAARFGTPTGLSNAVLLPHVMRFNAPAVGRRLNVLHEIFRAPSTMQPDQICAEFLASLPRPRDLLELGIKPGNFAMLLSDLRMDWFFHQNPRSADDAEIVAEVLEPALSHW